jgi:hypothetical protein
VGEGQQRPEGKASPTKIRTRDTSPRNGRKLFYMSQSPLLCPLVCCIMVSFVGISGSLFFFSSVLCALLCLPDSRKTGEETSLHSNEATCTRLGLKHTDTHASDAPTVPRIHPVPHPVHHARLCASVGDARHRCREQWCSEPCTRCDRRRNWQVHRRRCWCSVAAARGGAAAPVGTRQSRRSIAAQYAATIDEAAVNQNTKQRARVVFSGFFS